MESMWETEPAPASFAVFGVPSMSDRTTHFAVHIPWVTGLIGTRSIDKEIPGTFEMVDKAEGRIRDGQTAYDALEKIKAGRCESASRISFDATSKELGYALLLKRYIKVQTCKEQRG